MNNQNNDNKYVVDGHGDARDAHPVPDQEPKFDLELSEAEEIELKKKLEELRKRDPFIYR
jgi:hypothetical protein